MKRAPLLFLILRALRLAPARGSPRISFRIVSNKSPLERAPPALTKTPAPGAILPPIVFDPRHTTNPYRYKTIYPTHSNPCRRLFTPRSFHKPKPQLNPNYFAHATTNPHLRTSRSPRSARLREQRERRGNSKLSPPFGDVNRPAQKSALHLSFTLFHAALRSQTDAQSTSFRLSNNPPPTLKLARLFIAALLFLFSPHPAHAANAPVGGGGSCAYGRNQTAPWGSSRPITTGFTPA